MKLCDKVWLVVYLTIALQYLFIITFSVGSMIGQIEDKRTEEICAELAEKYKIEWQDTEFKDFDWYTSCVDNIRYTSPLRKHK